MNKTRLYTVLGVDVDADEMTIRRAFKKLSAQCQPDKNPEDPSAAELLQTLRDAWEVLSNPEQRAIYDEFGEASLKKNFSAEAARRAIEKEKADQARRAKAAMLAPTAIVRSAAPAGGTSGEAPARQSWEIQVAVGPRLARYGGALRIPVTRPVTCTRCEGSGRRAMTCQSCKGSRTMTAQRIETCVPCNGVGIVATQVQCKHCKGTGRRKGRKCSRCETAGIVVSRTYCGVCFAKGLKLIRFEQPCRDCNATGFSACTRCGGAGTVGKSLMMRLMVPGSVASDSLYRYAGAGFSVQNGAPTDLHVRFKVLDKAPRR